MLAKKDNCQTKKVDYTDWNWVAAELGTKTLEAGRLKSKYQTIFHFCLSLIMRKINRK